MAEVSIYLSWQSVGKEKNAKDQELSLELPLSPENETVVNTVASTISKYGSEAASQLSRVLLPGVDGEKGTRVLAGVIPLAGVSLLTYKQLVSRAARYSPGRKGMLWKGLGALCLVTVASNYWTYPFRQHALRIEVRKVEKSDAQN